VALFNDLGQCYSNKKHIRTKSIRRRFLKKSFHLAKEMKGFTKFNGIVDDNFLWLPGNGVLKKDIVKIKTK